jgi:hypothetical protein
MGGFVDLGGDAASDAASSKALMGAAKATKVCGTVLSLLPGGALIKGAANLTAAALEQTNASRRQNIVTQLGKNLTQAEASQVASDVAHRLTVAFSAQLELLAPIEQTGEDSSGGGFLSFLKSTCGVWRQAVEQDNIDVVDALAENGIDSFGEFNNNRELYMEAAIVAPKARFVRILIARGATFRDVISYSFCRFATPAAMAVLFGVGVDVAAMVVDWTLRAENSDQLLSLIAAGADLDALDSNNRRIDDVPVSNEAAVLVVAAGGRCGRERPPPTRMLAWARHRIAQRQFELLHFVRLKSASHCNLFVYPR